MSNIRITCDSTCDLTASLYETYRAQPVPLGVSLGDDFRRDGVDIKPQDIYAFAAATGSLPKTSAISVGEYEELFRSLTAQGDPVIHINLSSELSASHQNACLAAQMVGNVYVVDSRNLSSGSGHLVLMARELADQGKSPQEIVAALEAARDKLDVSFVHQTFSARFSSITCPLGVILIIRPV